ncbi:Protein of unknown function (DUF3602) [Geosmithia morbida]|uniref:Uncharacterized protein n=1 Tax=Geosmithia morbida TaxID=1094350 RepID=A0A9P4YP25_9HYPO|nr:Protein of unknown function (DUF3602) [Geosmithia morbida]KAF4120090.1 Protein of unknown function (DUF3602) [Geosmithia morbida]
MAPNFVITEPVPTTTTYVRAGRGGAGNTFRAPRGSASTPRITSADHSVVSPPSPSRRFYSGIGGAGNVHKAEERPAASLDDELRRLATREDNASERGHCGIGGAGNVYHRKHSDASASSSDDARSSMSSVSSRSKIWAHITGKEL